MKTRQGGMPQGFAPPHGAVPTSCTASISFQPGTAARLSVIFSFATRYGVAAGSLQGKPGEIALCRRCVRIDAFPPEVRCAVGFDGLDLDDRTRGVGLAHAHFGRVYRRRIGQLDPLKPLRGTVVAPRLHTVAGHRYIGGAGHFCGGIVRRAVFRTGRGRRGPLTSRVGKDIRFVEFGAGHNDGRG